jgi:hypothetical protein
LERDQTLLIITSIFFTAEISGCWLFVMAVDKVWFRHYIKIRMTLALTENKLKTVLYISIYILKLKKDWIVVQLYLLFYYIINGILFPLAKMFIKAG